ncbi:MAG: DUF4124 domain-containing protein [Janthinobacterium lividum]
MKAQLSAVPSSRGPLCHTLTVLALLCSSAWFAAPGWAQSDVFVCMNANGTREYKNTGETKGCKRVDMQGVTMIPSVTSAPRKASEQTASRATTPGDFPRIDTGTQKARDNDRMQILADELRNEEKKLAALKVEYNNGEPERRGDERNYAKYQERTAALKDDVSRTEKNIEALKREIGNSGK